MARWEFVIETTDNIKTVSKFAALHSIFFMSAIFAISKLCPLGLDTPIWSFVTLKLLASGLCIAMMVETASWWLFAALHFSLACIDNWLWWRLTPAQRQARYSAELAQIHTRMNTASQTLGNVLRREL